jgi:hypothetical protein
VGTGLFRGPTKPDAGILADVEHRATFEMDDSAFRDLPCYPRDIVS